MKFKFLAISDTHLGEDTSVLCFPEGRQHLWQTLQAKLGERARVDELILVGDIPDRTLSSTSQIVTQTNAFVQTLGSALDIGRVVYVPGNHDHTLWSGYLKARDGHRSGSTPPEGEAIVSQGARRDEGAAAELLSIFFGAPNGSTWRAIDGNPGFDFVVANPIYAREFQGRTYVFTHGTHFRKDVDLPERVRKVFDRLELDELVGGIELDTDGDVRRAETLEQLEDEVAGFVDSLWPSSGSRATSKSDRLWYLLSSISGKFSKKRLTPEDSQLLRWDQLPSAHVRIEQLTPGNDEPMHGSLVRCQEFFMPHLLGNLGSHGLSTEAITFVYGDTHDGGYGTLDEGNIRVYNTGAWVVHSAEHHPPCHVFAVDEEGQEYLLDVSFRGVQAAGRSLLEVAAADVEHRRQSVGKLARFLVKLLPSAEVLPDDD